METKLLYWEKMNLLEEEAIVLKVLEVEGKLAVILDATIFYPQGGGQPYDMGKIINKEGLEFLVKEVRNLDGVVYHFGEFSGDAFLLGEKVKLMVDQERRFLNSRLHTAGHIVDSALVKMGLKWSDSRGHHFPDGPYVAYQNLAAILPDLKEQLEIEANRLIESGFKVQALFIEKAEIDLHCFSGNFNFPEGKPLRIVKVYGEKGCPCGGTHVANIKEVGPIKISKIKNEKDWLRIRYDLV